MTEAANTETTSRPSGASMRKVALTSLAGTSIEWFDFFLYGTAAALVFPRLFFSEEMPYFVSLIASFRTLQPQATTPKGTGDLKRIRDHVTARAT